MATSPVLGTDEGFSDEEIAESLKPFFTEVDADYAAALPGLKAAFETKGPSATGDADDAPSR